MTRILYILPGLVPPGSDPARDEFTYLSEIAEGEILLPIWASSPKTVAPFLRETFPVYRVGRFRYHMLLCYRFPSWLRPLATLFFYIQRGLQLHREKAFDVIVAWGTNRPAIAGVFLRWITGAKLIVELPLAPEDQFRYDAPNPGFRAAVKHFFADRILLFVGRMSDCLRLVYPWQLQRYPQLQNKKKAVFHFFVPVRTIKPREENERYVLLVGAPWYRKGVDVLIRAFKLIANRFPEYKLKLMGFYPDRQSLDDLAAGCSQIEFVRAAPNEFALNLIGRCSVFVSASRSEGFARVLQEAMAARKPIIASAIAGTPFCIEDNVSGLLFRSENVEELAAKLATLLSDEALRTRVAERGHERVMTEFDERAYVRAFQRMLNDVTNEALRDLTTDKALNHAPTVSHNSQASGPAQSVDR